MTTSLANIAGALKRIYDSGVVQQQNLRASALDEIGKAADKYNAGGDGFFFATDLSGNESVGAINETETFRTIDFENYAQGVVRPKVLVGPVQFSGLAAKAAEGDEESFVNVVVDAIEKAKDRLMKDANRQFYGLGNGLLASPAGAVASAVTSFSVGSAQYLRANMVIDIFQGGSKIVDSIRLGDVDKVNNVVFLASGSLTTSFTAAAELVKENIRDSAPTDGKEMLGLRGIVDDGTDLVTLEGISSATNRIWRSRRIAAASANLTSDLLQRLLDDVDVLSGEAPDLILMHPAQRRKYLDIVVPQKRYQDGKMDAGHSKLSFNGIDLMIEQDCQLDTVYALNKKHLHRFEVDSMKLASHDGSDVFLRLANADQFQAYWRWYCNLGTKKRNAHGKIVGLATPSAVG